MPTPAGASKMNDPGKPEVHAVHRVLGQALLSDNTIVPVTNWFGPDGEDCDPFKAVSCVCGSEEAGWYAVNLSAFSMEKVH